MKEVDLRTSEIRKALIKVDSNINSVVNNIKKSDKFSDILLLIKDAFKPLVDIEGKVNDYHDLAAKIRGEFKDIGVDLLYLKDDVELINSLSSSNKAMMESIRGEYEARITSLIFASKLSGVEDSTIQAQASALVIPNKKIAGRAIKGVLDTEVETFIMEADATIMLKKGQEAGITSYKYIGSLIKDSRPWCVKHLNKTLTEEQIQEWNKSRWKGKKSGNPFIARGGWRCRHHFAPTVG